MQRRARRTTLAPGVEDLEPRTLLSAGDLLVRFNGGEPSPAVALVLERLGASIVTSYPDGPSVVRLAPGADASAAASRLAAARGVAYAEPDRPVRLRDAAPITDDPNIADLWGLNNPNDIDVDAPEAWSITTGSPSVVVAIIDSGADVSHPDLAGRIWTNPGELPGNGLDDDRNGKIDDVNGWNFIEDSPRINDTDGHGTHLAGIIAANANNGLGVAGVAPGVRVMPLKFIGWSGSGAVSDAVDAIYYAVAEGAKVINASWGGGGYSKALVDAVRFAGTRGVVFVTAAGNDASSEDARPGFPPGVRLPNLISVAAVDSAGSLASFSNYGPRSVDLAAPGVNILSTTPGGRYERLSGTSMAAPYVAGVVALAASRFPNLSAAQLVQRVTANVKPIVGLTGRLINAGMVDAFRALTGAGPAGDAPAADPNAIPVPDAQGTLSPDAARAVILGSDAYFRLQGGNRKAFLRGLYRDVLGARLRQPVQRALLKQMRRGASRELIARAVLASPGAQNRKVAGWFPAGAPGGPLSTQSDVLSYSSLLAAGWTDDAVHASLLGSDAYWSAASGTPEGFATALYRDALGRAPTPDELDRAATQVRAGRPREDIARDLLATDEARRIEVARWFQTDLRRPLSLPELAAQPDVSALAAQIGA